MVGHGESGRTRNRPHAKDLRESRCVCQFHFPERDYLIASIGLVFESSIHHEPISRGHGEGSPKTHMVPCFVPREGSERMGRLGRCSQNGKMEMAGGRVVTPSFREDNKSNPSTRPTVFMPSDYLTSPHLVHSPSYRFSWGLSFFLPFFLN